MQTKDGISTGFKVPSIQLGQDRAKQISTLGFLVLGVGLRIVAPLLGPLTMLAGGVSLLWLSLYKKNSAEDAFKDKRGKELLCVGLLFCIPVVGILVAGVFAKKRMSHVQDSGIGGGVEALAEIVGYPFRGLVLRAFFPLSQAHISVKEKDESPPSPQIYECTVSLSNGKTRTIEIVRQRDKKESANRAVLIFPGRSATGVSDDPQAREYAGNNDKNIKFDVYTVTLGGYPKTTGVDKGVETTETTCIQDANAVVNFLKNSGYKEIALHGNGIGCVPVLAAAQLHADVVKAVVLDRGFTSAKEVVVNAVRNFFSRFGLARWVPEPILRGFGGSAFPVSLKVDGVGGEIITNQMDNSERIRRVKTPIAFVEANDDQWMSRTNRSGAKISFSQDLQRLHIRQYPDFKDKDFLLTLPGNHGAPLPQNSLVDWVDRMMRMRADVELPEGEAGDTSSSSSSSSSLPSSPHSLSSSSILE